MQNRSLQIELRQIQTCPLTILEVVKRAHFMQIVYRPVSRHLIHDYVHMHPALSDSTS